MNRNIKILYHTFSFLLVIPILLLIENLFTEFNINIGFYFGWIIGNVLSIFLSTSLYVDYIETKKNKIRIEYTNSLLIKGVSEYDLVDLKKIRIKKQSYFGGNEKLDVEFERSNKKFVFLKNEKEMINNEIDKIIELKKN